MERHPEANRHSHSARWSAQGSRRRHATPANKGHRKIQRAMGAHCGRCAARRNMWPARAPSGLAPPVQWMPPLYRSPRWVASSLCARSRYRRPNRRVAATLRHWSSFRSAQPPAATAAAARRTVPHAQLPSQPLETIQWSGCGRPGWRCLHSSRRTRSFARECRRNSRSRRYLLSGVCSAPLQYPPGSFLAS